MCGENLQVGVQRGRRVSPVDALLVLAVLAVLVFWWQIGSRPQEPNVETGQAAILPENIPQLDPTPTSTPTATPAPTSTPVTAQQTFLSHSVQSGDTLLSIAGEYDVTVEALQQANNLADDFLSIGQELTIPVLRVESAEPEGVISEFVYSVREGDTVVSIATLFGSTIQAILRANGLSATDIILPGQVLTVPVTEVPDDVIASSQAAPAAAVNSDDQQVVADADVIFIQPRLIGPSDQERFGLNESIPLRWVSVDVLGPSEWYVLSIYPREGAAQPLGTRWTKQTSVRLGTDLAPPPGQSASYAWQVSVVRTGRTSEGNILLEAASPPSDLRVFIWQ